MSNKSNTKFRTLAFYVNDKELDAYIYFLENDQRDMIRMANFGITQALKELQIRRAEEKENE